MNLHSLNLRTGDLRHRVTLQQATSAPRDSYGQPQPSWESVLLCWAYIEPLSGRELVNAQQIKAETNHVVIMRWNPHVTADPSKRLVYEGRIFKIGAVRNILERNVKLVAYCTEQVVPVTP